MPVRKTILIAFLLIAFPLSASASDPNKWTWEDTALQTVYSSLLIADWSQTLHIARENLHFTKVRGRYYGNYYYEENKILGKHPTKNEVNKYFFLSLTGHAAISYLLPKPYRTVWQSIFIYIEYDAIQNNRQQGIGISLHF